MHPGPVSWLVVHVLTASGRSILNALIPVQSKSIFIFKLGRKYLKKMRINKMYCTRSTECNNKTVIQTVDVTGVSKSKLYIL